MALGNTTIVLFGLVFLFSCSTEVLDKQTSKSNNKCIDTIQQVFPDILDDPKRKINEFGLEIDYLPIKNIFIELTKSQRTKEIFKSDLCAGDNCTSFKIISDSASKKELYLIKADYGEYGFANDQFYFENKNLKVTRHFSLGVEEYPTDSTSTKFLIEEKIFLFENDKVIIKKRREFLSYKKIEAFSDIKFTDSISEASRIITERTEELKYLMSIEKIAD